jgi:hypothetical protein
MARSIIAIYEDDLGVAVSGLSALITVWNITDPASPTKIISGLAMTEIGEGAYIYNFVAYSGELSYLFKCDGGAEMDGLDRYVWSTNETDPASIADQVWGEARVDHTASGTFGHGYSTTEGWSIAGR